MVQNHLNVFTLKNALDDIATGFNYAHDTQKCEQVNAKKVYL